MIEAYIAVELAGASKEALRRHAKAAFDLANELQHKRTADFRHAALSSEATVAVINLIAIASSTGRRDPSRGATMDDDDATDSLESAIGGVETAVERVETAV